MELWALNMHYFLRYRQFINRCKFGKFHRKTPASESFLIRKDIKNILNRDSNAGVFYRICEILKNICERLLLSPRLPLLIIYTSVSNWYLRFSFCIIIYSFVCQFSLHYYWYCFKVRLPPSKTICVICLIESPLKVMKNPFYFTLKALFVLKIFKFLSWLFGHA